MSLDFWDTVRQRLVALGKSQTWLAEQSGVKRTAINNGIGRSAEGKMSSPSVESAYAIARVLDTTVEHLLTGQDPHGLAPDERELVDSYRRLDDRDRQEVFGIIMLKLERYPQKGASRLGAVG
ncbi:MAG: helix-turn-helix transcriptional regulator [Treponema sp.]|jgi:transcriptional regulator with XRE-family HTH domain|nr:helix-turn-helix transcriptional regulator [Treponema sp.]